MKTHTTLCCSISQQNEEQLQVAKQFITYRGPIVDQILPGGTVVLHSLLHSRDLHTYQHNRWKSNWLVHPWVHIGMIWLHLATVVHIHPNGSCGPDGLRLGHRPDESLLCLVWGEGTGQKLCLANCCLHLQWKITGVTQNSPPPQGLYLLPRMLLGRALGCSVMQVPFVAVGR